MRSICMIFASIYIYICITYTSLLHIDIHIAHDHQKGYHSPCQTRRKIPHLSWSSRIQAILLDLHHSCHKPSRLHVLHPRSVKQHTPRHCDTSTGWWLNPPIWKICSSNWMISPGRGENIKYLKLPPSQNTIWLALCLLFFFGGGEQELHIKLYPWRQKTPVEASGFPSMQPEWRSCLEHLPCETATTLRGQLHYMPFAPLSLRIYIP